MNFNALILAIIAVGSLAMILLVGYPGDGARGVDTVFGRAERASHSQYARGWR